MKFNLVFLGKTPFLHNHLWRFPKTRTQISPHTDARESFVEQQISFHTSKQVLLRRKTDSSAGASSAMVSSTRSSSALARALKQPTPMKTKPKNDQHFRLPLKINKSETKILDVVT